jgi:hypothetical protein
MPVVLLAELKLLQKEQFFYNVIFFKSRNSNYYKNDSQRYSAEFF